MANIAKITDATGSTKHLLLKDSNKVFLQSKNINVFPCSRRGLYKVLGPDQELSLVKQYDPEARLNTERTNRLHTAVNGFKDSFIINENFATSDTLKFILAGYWVEVKNFDPAKIAEQLGTTANIYAQLRLHTGVSLDAEGYYTEILANQFSEQAAERYLDISYTASDNTSDFFVGISFVSSQTSEENEHTLHLFSKSGSSWVPVQTSLLPKIEHDTTEDSIKVSGDFTVNHGSKDEFKLTDNNATLTVPTVINSTLAVTKPASVTGVAATISGGATIATGNLTVSTGALTISAGDTTLQKLDAGTTTLDSLTVNEDVLTVDDSVDIIGDTQITGNLTVTDAGSSTSTPTLKVDTITSVSEEATDIIEVQKPLNITSDSQTSIVGPVVVDNTLTADNIKVDAAGTLDVKTITNTKSGDTAITVNKGLDIAGTVKVDTITNTDGSAKAIAVGAPLEITWPTPATDNAISLKVANGATTLRKLEATELKVATDKLTVTSTTASFNVPVTVNSSLEATTSVKTPSLNVQTIQNTKIDATTGANLGVAVDDDLSISGSIVAQSNITAEKDLIAKQNINAGGNLVVGTDNATNTGTITAKTLVTAPTLEATNSLSVTGNTTIGGTLAAVDGLIVAKTATVKDSDGVDTTVGEVKAHQVRVNRITSDSGTITIDNKNLVVNNKTVSAKEVTAEKITQNGNPIPAIALSQIGTSDSYQLQITLNAAKKSED